MRSYSNRPFHYESGDLQKAFGDYDFPDRRSDRSILVDWAVGVVAPQPKRVDEEGLLQIKLRVSALTHLPLTEVLQAMSCHITKK